MKKYERRTPTSLDSLQDMDTPSAGLKQKMIPRYFRSFRFFPRFKYFATTNSYFLLLMTQNFNTNNDEKIYSFAKRKKIIFSLFFTFSY